MATLTRDALVTEINNNLMERYGGDLVVGRDADKILVFSPGGPFFSVRVEELQLAPKRERKKAGA